MSFEVAQLLSLATAVPGYVITQTEVAQRTRRVFGLKMPAFDRLAPVFDNAGITQRYAVKPGAWYEEPHSWEDRTAVYLEGAVELFVSAARKALRSAGFSAADIDTVVTVSSTGIAAPSLEARAAAELGFGPHVLRVPVFGLGCAGGVTGLSIASRLAEARPGRNVLLVAVELCTLAVRLDQLTKANIVALALFGDGAAAAVVRAGGGDAGLARLDGGAEHTWPETLGIMGWNIDGQGFGVVFDRSIPEFVKRNFAEAVGSTLGRMGIEQGDLARMICHPGGAKVVDAIESALHLEQGVLDHERGVLRDFGNMSAPTALFVLERVLKDAPKGDMMLAALGPGFTASMLPLRLD